MRDPEGDDDEDRYAEYLPRHRPDSRGSRPRTKTRPQHLDAVTGFVIAVDRGRYRCVVDQGRDSERLVSASRARELRTQAIVTGDLVDIVGDTSGSQGSLGRIVRIHERSTVLRRSGDDSDTLERIIVANADQLLMVVAAASPEPRLRLIDRYIVAALDAGLTPILCVTKTDLATPELLRDYAHTLHITAVERSPENPAREELVALLRDHVTVLVGHSGVGKSTLVNDLVPGADRAVGVVNDVTGRGRHTSSSSSALALPEGGWVIDTPGVRSFGLGHVSSDSIIQGFPELTEFVEHCPKACPHTEATSDCEISRAVESGELSDFDVARAHSLQRLLGTIHDISDEGK